MKTIELKMKNLALSLSLAIVLATSLTANSQDSKQPEQLIFPKGNAGPTSTFTGKAYNYGLVANDTVYNTLVGNVYFEPGARSHWHMHQGGQILIVTDGEGYHQIEGQPKQIMKKGDVIKCPPNVRHWHGATEKSSLSQLYILPHTEKGIVKWMEAVTDEQYKSTK